MPPVGRTIQVAPLENRRHVFGLIPFSSAWRRSPSKSHFAARQRLSRRSQANRVAEPVIGVICSPAHRTQVVLGCSIFRCEQKNRRQRRSNPPSPIACCRPCPAKNAGICSRDVSK